MENLVLSTSQDGLHVFRSGYLVTQQRMNELASFYAAPIIIDPAKGLANYI